MLVLVCVAAAMCVIVGARAAAAKLFRWAVIVGAAVSLLPLVIEGCSTWLRRTEFRNGPGLAPTLLVLFGIIGYIAWRTRAVRARGIEGARRRNGSPRERALPAPPRDPRGPR